MLRAFLAFLAALLVAGMPSGAAIAREGPRDTAADLHASPPRGYARLDRVLEPEELGVDAPGAIAWDRSAAALIVQDRSTGRASAITPVGRKVGTRPGFAFRTGSALSTVDAASGHSFVLDPRTGTLLELETDGTQVSTRDLSELPLANIQGIAIAPSGDPSDDPKTTSLYISDAGTTTSGTTTDAAVYEVAMSEPILSTSLASAASADGSIVQTIDTSSWSPASPDPSGLAYIPAGTNPSADRLVSADGEVDETTGAGFHGNNVWLSTRTGAAARAINTLLASPTNNEPVGAAFDPVHGELYLAKDGSSSRVWVYRLETDGSFAQVRYFTIHQHGVADAEGLAFGNGTLFVSDGTGKEIWKLSGGQDGRVGTTDDGAVTHFDTAALGISDPEGIGFHPTSGNLWVASKKPGEGILEVTQSGSPVTLARYSGNAPLNPGGLEVAPSSFGTGMSIWIADRGVDNNSDPRENDGKIHEVAIGEGTPPPPPPDPGENVIVNGGFEDANADGAPTGWTIDARFRRSSANTNSGSYSGLHRATDNSGYKIQQDAPVAGGQQYAFGTWVNAPTTSDAFKVVFKIQWRSNSGKLTTATLGKLTRHTGGEWAQITSTVTAPSGATTARVLMVVSSLNAEVYVDDMVLASP